MSSPEGYNPTKGKALMEALRRVKSGRPWQFENKEEAKEGKLRVTFVTVAREAGVSRGLISRDATAYVEERRAIKQAMGIDGAPNEPKSSATAQVESLREKKRELERHVRVLATRVHDAVLENLELQKKNDKLADDLADANEALRRATVRRIGKV